MARFLLILSYDAPDPDEARRYADDLRYNSQMSQWTESLRLEGVYQEQPIGEQR